jgi:hypothetical protein
MISIRDELPLLEEQLIHALRQPNREPSDPSLESGLRRSFNEQMQVSVLDRKLADTKKLCPARSFVLGPPAFERFPGGRYGTSDCWKHVL